MEKFQGEGERKGGVWIFWHFLRCFICLNNVKSKTKMKWEWKHSYYCFYSIKKLFLTKIINFSSISTSYYLFLLHFLLLMVLSSFWSPFSTLLLTLLFRILSFPMSPNTFGRFLLNGRHKNGPKLLFFGQFWYKFNKINEYYDNISEKNDFKTKKITNLFVFVVNNVKTQQCDDLSCSDLS